MDTHVLPEVRPFVRNMPEETYVVQTDGSARSRELKTDNFRVRISGVPGHTHNSTAIASISHDFSLTRQVATTLPASVFSDAAVALLATDYTDSAQIEDETRRLDRAIEKGIGRISVIPENCHQQIEEPVQAIAEVRTLVTAKDQLESLTYIEELGGFVDATSGVATGSAFPDVYIDMLGYGGTVDLKTTDKLARNTPVYIKSRDKLFRHQVCLDANGNLGQILLAGTQPAATLPQIAVNAALLPAQATIVGQQQAIIDPNQVTVDQQQAIIDQNQAIIDAFVFDGQGNQGAHDTAVAARDQAITARNTARGTRDDAIETRDEANAEIARLTALIAQQQRQYDVAGRWDGTVRFEWDEDERRYSSADLLLHLFACAEVTEAEDPNNDDTVPQATSPLFVTIKAFHSSKADGGSCFICPSTRDDAASHATLTNGNLFAPLLEVDVHSAVNAGSEGPYHWYGPPCYRVPVGGSMALPGAPRTLTAANLHANDGQSYWQRINRLRSTARLATAWSVEFRAEANNKYVGTDANIEDAADPEPQNGGILWRASADFMQPVDAPLSEHRIFSADVKQPRVSMFEHANANKSGAIGLNMFTHAGNWPHNLLEVVSHPIMERNYLDGLDTQPPADANTEPAEYQFDHGSDQFAQMFPIRSGIFTTDQSGRYPVHIEQSWDFDNTHNSFKTYITDHWLPQVVHKPLDHYSLMPMQMTFFTAFARAPTTVDVANAPGTPHVPSNAELATALLATETPLENLQAATQALNVQLAIVQAAAGTYTLLEIQAAQALIDGPNGNDGLQAAYNTVLALWQPLDTFYRSLLAWKAAAVALGEAGLHEHQELIFNNVSQTWYAKWGNRAATETALPPEVIQFRILGDVIDAEQSGFTMKTELGKLVAMKVTDTGALDQNIHQMVSILPEAKTVDRWHQVNTGTGNVIELPLTDFAFGNAPGNKLEVKGVALGCAPTREGEPSRYGYILFNDVGNTQANLQHPTIVQFDLHKVTHRAHKTQTWAFWSTIEEPLCYRQGSDADTLIPFTTAHFAAVAGRTPTWEGAATRVTIELESANLTALRFADTFGTDARVAAAADKGLVFRSRKRVSEPICAPLLNPNVRIGCMPPLNFDSRHLPPELRDFQLVYKDVDFSFLPGTDWSFGPLKTFEFSGGNQVQTAQGSLLYLPEFRLFQIPSDGEKFSLTCYSSLGMPSYMCLYARFKDAARGQNFQLTQPMIQTLNMRCDTTKRKSDVVCDDLGKHQLYHMTQRNVHPASNYNSSAYNRRQTILLCAEDIGMMGLKPAEYQRLKRVRIELLGTLNYEAQVYALFVYNNRGLEVDGAKLQIVRV